MSTHARATASLANGLIDEAPELLTDDQCGALLASGAMGRVGVTVGGLPVIQPVNYAYVDGDVVFHSGEEALLRSARAGAVIAFEIDGVDEIERQRWSVLIVGRVITVTDAHNLDHVRLRPEMLSGRRVYIT